MSELCVSPSGICVAEPVQVSVSLPLSVDIPLPYQVVRGEQLELKGSVYNQQVDNIRVPTTHHSQLHMILFQRHSDDNNEGFECYMTAVFCSSVFSSVLRDADGRPGAVPAAVAAGCWRGGAALHRLQLEPSCCRGGG